MFTLNRFITFTFLFCILPLGFLSCKNKPAEKDDFASDSSFNDVSDDVADLKQIIDETEQDKEPAEEINAEEHFEVSFAALEEKKLLAEKIFMPVIDIDAKYWVMQIAAKLITRTEIFEKALQWEITDVYRNMLLNKIDFILNNRKNITALNKKEKAALNKAREKFKKAVESLGQKV